MCTCKPQVDCSRILNTWTCVLCVSNETNCPVFVLRRHILSVIINGTLKSECENWTKKAENMDILQFQDTFGRHPNVNTAPKYVCA